MSALARGAWRRWGGVYVATLRAIRVDRSHPKYTLLWLALRISPRAGEACCSLLPRF